MGYLGHPSRARAHARGYEALWGRILVTNDIDRGTHGRMRDVLVVLDLFQDFGHQDGERLLASLSARRDVIARVLDHARRSEVPIVFANDHPGVWDSDARRIVAHALSGPGGDQLRNLVPQPGERIVLKPRYSAFEHTPLALLLEDIDCERVVLIGMTTEGCVAQSAIDARELGYKVSIVPTACGTTDVHLERIALKYLGEVVGVYLHDANVFST